MVSLFVLFGVRIWACCHKGCRVNGVIVCVVWCAHLGMLP